MRFNILIKVIPFLSTLLLILILSVSNQKENTKIRILIWNTPLLTLGSYLAISTASGFILAYSITASLVKLSNSQSKQKLRFNDNYQYIETYNNIDQEVKPNYDNTLIERDIKDPLPTINANFRVITRKERRFNNTAAKSNPDSYSIKSKDDYYDSSEQEKNINNVNSQSKDWNDNSFSEW